MSRAYRIRVRETLKRVLGAKDGVSTQLELLEVLPPEQMAQLLTEELVRRGFQPRGKTVVRQGQGVTVQVEPETGTVTVQAEASERVCLEDTKEGIGDLDRGGAGDKQVKEILRGQARQDLEKQVAQEEARLQSQVTDRLEAELSGLRRELDQVVNRVTAEALKRKAAQLGRIKEMSEDPQSGSLTIVLEV